MVTLAAAAGAGNIATAGGGSGGDRRPSTIGRRDSKSCWSLDGPASMDSVMMVVPSDSPVTLCGLQDSTDGVQCTGCSGYYLDSNGHPVYGVDYVRYWDCCGASTESIESKVEQALELVKSHLMFAVREEMRALKDEFDELLRKNERLELENRLLRAHSSSEVLKQLGLELNKIQSSSSSAAAPPPR